MKKSILFLIIFAVLTGCSKFEEINSNPNATEKVTPAMLATSLILSITKSATGKPFVTPDFLTKTMAWGENGDGYQYNSFGRTSMDYTSLTNIKKMVNLADDSDKNAYNALGLFIKAYRLFYMSLDLGDIPYSEALMGEEGNVTPKYDTQKEVMLHVLADLQAADEGFAAGRTFSGDPIYNGNVQNWRRTVNAFRLKVLLHLSKKADDADLKIKEKFAQIVESSPLLQNNGQNFQLVFSDKVNQLYPFNKTIHKFVEYPMVSSLLIDSLKKMNDYRLFYYANPSVFQTKNMGLSMQDWNAYLGVDPADVFSNLKTLWAANKFCLLNLRYTDYIPGEPLVRIGFAEQNFIIAEAISRGWLTGNAKDYYENGIKAAMKFVADNTPDNENYHHNRKITDSYVQTYLTGSFVNFAATSEKQIKQILQQKYFLRFLQNPYEAYYEYRRTGYPNWPINPTTNLNEVKDKVPVRWMYPMVEYTRNEKNVRDAIARQYGGQDSPNDLMWILK